jgi:hypothetical protein
VRAIIEKIPAPITRLQEALQARLRANGEAVQIALRDEQSTQRYARKLLHRLSQTLAFALLCELAARSHLKGDELPAHSAWLYFEDIEPQGLGNEDDVTRKNVLESLREELPATAKSS